jgi:hypothetical protein
MMYSAMMVTFDCNSPIQKPSGACVVRKKCCDRVAASVTRLIHSPELEASATMAESGCLVMGDLLYVVGPCASMCSCDLRSLLTHPSPDRVKPFGSLFQPASPSVILGWKCSIIYPVEGQTVKGILADVGCQIQRPRHLWSRCCTSRGAIKGSCCCL